MWGVRAGRARAIIVRSLVFAVLLGGGVMAANGSDGTAEARLLYDGVAPATPSDALSAGAPAAPEPLAPGRPGDVALTNGALRDAVKRLRNGLSAAPDVEVVGGTRVRVEILNSLPPSQVRRIVSDLGGAVEGEVPGALLQAIVPYDRLAELEAQPGVQSVRPPLQANVPIAANAATSGASEAGPAPAAAVVGEEIAKTNADDWIAAGYTGAGVKVGIVDYFDGTLWNNAQAAGELPAPAGTFCLTKRRRLQHLDSLGR